MEPVGAELQRMVHEHLERPDRPHAVGGLDDPDLTERGTIDPGSPTVEVTEGAPGATTPTPDRSNDRSFT